MLQQADDVAIACLPNKQVVRRVKGLATSIRRKQDSYGRQAIVRRGSFIQGLKAENDDVGRHHSSDAHVRQTHKKIVDKIQWTGHKNLQSFKQFTELR